MGKEITSQISSSTLATAGPSTMTRTFSDRLAWYVQGIVRHGDMTETTRPVDELSRLGLQKRLGELQITLGEKARDRAAIAMAVAELMNAFRNAGFVKEAEARETIAAYVKVLDDRPPWAVRRVCEQIAKGQIEGISLDRPPAAPRLRDTVNKLLEPLFQEAHQLREVLNARPIRNAPPEERERVIAGFSKLMADLKMPRRVSNG